MFNREDATYQTVGWKNLNAWRGLAQVKKISTMFQEISNQSTEKAGKLLPKAIKLIEKLKVEDWIKNKLLEIWNRMIEDNNKRSVEVWDKVSGALWGMWITWIPAVTLGKMKSNVDSSKVEPVSTPKPSSVSDPTSTPASVETPTPKKKPKYIYKPSNTITPDYTEANKSYAERKDKLDLLDRIKADKASWMDVAWLQEKYMWEYNKNYTDDKQVKDYALNNF